MIQEFNRRMEHNLDFQTLLDSLAEIPEFPVIQLNGLIKLEEIEQLMEIIKKSEEIKQNKLNVKYIQEYSQLIQEIKNNNSTVLYRSCEEQFQKYIKNLDYHTSCQIANFKLNPLDLEQFEWVRSNGSQIVDLEERIEHKMKELIQLQIGLSIVFQQNENDIQYVYQSKNMIIYKINSQLFVQTNCHIKLQSEMIAQLKGYLTLNDYLKLNLQQYIVGELAKFYKSYCIKTQIIIDEYENDCVEYEQEIKQLIQLTNLQQINEKYYQFSKLDSIKQNLVSFKDKYMNLIDKLDFKQQNSQGWKNLLFKSKEKQFQKCQSSFFDEFKIDCKKIDEFLSIDDENIHKLIIDHYLLIHICLQNKTCIHNFQSLNFYVSIYTQLESQINKIITKLGCEGNLSQLIEVICEISIIIREYSSQLAEFVDL